MPQICLSELTLTVTIAANLHTAIDDCSATCWTFTKKSKSFFILSFILLYSYTTVYFSLAACEIHDVNSIRALTSHLLYCSDQIKEMSHWGTFVSGTTLASIIVFITYLKHFVLHKKMVWLINLCLYGYHVLYTVHACVHLFIETVWCSCSFLRHILVLVESHMHQLFKDKWLKCEWWRWKFALNGCLELRCVEIQFSPVWIPQHGNNGSS